MPVEDVDVKTVTMRVVTPVHISGDSFPVWMWGTDAERVYVLDVETLAESVGIEGIPRIMGELVSSKDNWEQYREFYNEVVGLKPDKNLDRMSDLVLFIRSGSITSAPYFPGSSIKGSLRTAVLGSAIESDGFAFKKLCSVIADVSRNLNKGGRRPNKNVFKFVFQKWYGLAPHYDPFRAVSISDATIDGDFVVCNTVRKKLRSGQLKQSSSGPKSSYEFLVKGTLRFTVNFDVSLWNRLAPDYLKNLGIDSVDDLLNCWSTWYKKVIEFMRDKNYPLQGVNASKPVMIGRHSGYLSKTVALAIDRMCSTYGDYAARNAVLQLVNAASHRRKLWPETSTCWVASHNGAMVYPGILELV